MRQRPTLQFALFAIVVASACACAGTDTTGPAANVPCASTPETGVSRSENAGLSIWSVLPRSTDICISQRPDSHFVYRASSSAPAVSRLFLFLPGTAALVRDSRLILSQAAKAGYHVLGLTYPNEQSLADLCALQAGTCFGDTRLEILTGQGTSAAVSIDRANSIENRVVRLLQLMRTVEPAGNWGQFLVGDSVPAWDKISVAGHEQGGGFALFIAQRYVVARATAYSSFGDALATGGGLAPWVTRAYATPITRVFGVISTFDEVISPTAALAAWTAIGMGSALVDLDITAMPYGSAQRFITAVTPLNGLTTRYPNHSVLTVDFNTPVRQGLPTLAGIWQAVSFPAP